MMDFALALCGEMRTGKDTVAKYLEEQYGFSPYAFGDKLKEEFHDNYPHIPRDPKPVRGYQLFGQLQRYVEGEDYWINKCLSDVRMGQIASKGYSWATAKPDFRPVITDMRQPNEFERCMAEGFITIRVEAPLEARMERIKAEGDQFDQKNLNFETETHLRSFKVHHIVKNYRDLQYLYDQVDSIMNKYGVTKKITK